MVFQFLLSQGRYWWNGIRSWLFYLDYRDSGWLNSLKEQPKPGLKDGRLGPGCKFPLVSVLDNVVIKVEVRVWVWNPLKSCSCKRAKLGQPVRAGDWQLDSATRLRTTFTTSVNGSSLTHWHLHFLGPDQRSRGDVSQARDGHKYALIILNQPFSRALLDVCWKASEWRSCADGGANRLHDLLSRSAGGCVDERSEWACVIIHVLVTGLVTVVP